MAEVTTRVGDENAPSIVRPFPGHVAPGGSRIVRTCLVIAAPLAGTPSN
jgi:hypothetical protein